MPLGGNLGVRRSTSSHLSYCIFAHLSCPLVVLPWPRERVGKYPGDTMYYSINLALLSGSAGADPAFTRRGPKAKTHRAGHYRIIHSFIMHARLVADVAMHHPPSSSHPPSSVLCPPSPQVLVLPIDADCGYRPLKSLSTRVLKVNRRSAK